MAALDELAEPWASMKDWPKSGIEYLGGVNSVPPEAYGHSRSLALKHVEFRSLLAGVVLEHQSGPLC